ncbi:hypothetical protein PHAVU_001G062350 [Phaseolus vulgaris]|uniref:Bifunctional inhibitor/plant lipid transfer protein/seed storage helical domain-containing protein n=1 Tax=Phaseolus vulgaris TaxID=3885 RepID=V7D0E9_PHAVU|nr:hypothetical protein PHAVU_L007100g [Phaseolus vulgaris]ESW35892.1 hypothetical protein PHAVU_L007100g [Phaseolus vulgaris]
MKSVYVPFLSLVAVLVLTVAAIEPPKALTYFLTDKTNTPPTPCCQGLNKLIVSTPTKEEKLAACKCLKEAASHIPNFDVGRVNNLPKVCNINVNYPISKDFDCENIIKN